MPFLFKIVPFLVKNSFDYFWAKNISGRVEYRAGAVEAFEILGGRFQLLHFALREPPVLVRLSIRKARELFIDGL